MTVEMSIARPICTIYATLAQVGGFDWVVFHFLNFLLIGISLLDAFVPTRITFR